ncbi:MAG: glycosyltransferase [Pelagibacteraceae bacterium]
MTKKTSLILCTFNEKNYIENSIRLINENIDNCEIIIVDDNSNDGTLEILDKIKSIYNFKLFVRKNERGLASAQLKGFMEASGDYLGTVDVNSKDQILYFKKLILELNEGYDIASLSRYLKNGGDQRIMIRSLSSRLINLVCKILLRIPFTDFTSGIFLMRKNVLNETKHLITGYAEWYIEFIYILYKKKFKIKEIPYVQTIDDTDIQSKSFPNLFTFLYLGSKYFLRAIITIFRN